MSSLLSLSKKKLLYRSWHRGCKEIDILLGNFALINIESLSEREVLDYETIVNTDDYDLYGYITENQVIPDFLNQKLMKRIIDFSKGNNLLLSK